MEKKRPPRLVILYGALALLSLGYAALYQGYLSPREASFTVSAAKLVFVFLVRPGLYLFGALLVMELVLVGGCFYAAPSPARRAVRILCLVLLSGYLLLTLVFFVSGRQVLFRIFNYFYVNPLVFGLLGAFYAVCSRPAPAGEGLEEGGGPL